MAKKETALGQQGGSTDAAQSKPASYAYYSTSTTACQYGWVMSKTWAGQFWPAVCDLMQRLGYGEPTATRQRIDWLGVDFLTAGGKRWAWRNCSASCLRYRDVTIRVSRPSGAKTERHKLRHVHFLLFTWTAGNDIKAWMILRADRVRQLLDHDDWPALQMPDARAACIPFSALQRAGAIVDADGTQYMNSAGCA